MGCLWRAGDVCGGWQGRHPPQICGRADRRSLEDPADARHQGRASRSLTAGVNTFLTLFCQGGLMQVSATLIAAQQAAREARTRLQVPQPPQAAKANFAAALEKTSGTAFSPLPLRQTAPVAAQAVAQPQASGRMGQHVDIIV